MVVPLYDIKGRDKYVSAQSFLRGTESGRLKAGQDLHLSNSFLAAINVIRIQK
jgi:hypothetical protein